jgi:Mrp family chromosome partitioning ATPase
LLIDVPPLDLRSPSDQLVVRDAPASPGAEAFAFAAQMQFGSDTGTPGRGVVIALTSAESGTGTTTVVANLGLALAQSGLLVLLIDGAVASGPLLGQAGAGPSLTELFLGPGGAFLGLLDVTERGVALADAAGTVGDRRLVLLGSGSRHTVAANGNGGAGAADERFVGLKASNGASPEAPVGAPTSTTGTSSRRAASPTITQPSIVSTGLGAFAVDQLLVEARDLFDFILIDAPPVLSIGARGVLLQSADQVVMVVAEGEPVDPVHDSTGRIHALGANVAGYVYNQTANRAPSGRRRRSSG